MRTRVHYLKCWPVHFEQVAIGNKTCEIRKWDRPFAVGDVMVLREFNPTSAHATEGEYTGRELARRITHIIRPGMIGLVENYAVISLGAHQQLDAP